ncbi:hypothetical protein [Streptomyces sp. NPDC090445]|uniref:hypothetical protein n=1 Tax=Streptomyces sp. NPDC090445 TaxID=3365963 RepID=UPI0037F66465
MPERSLLGIISRTAYWVEWWRRFGPASGNEPKLKDPFGRYVITTFVKGTNMGPYGSAVAADGTHMDTYLNNLLSETSVRYGAPAHARTPPAPRSAKSAASSAPSSCCATSRMPRCADG